MKITGDHSANDDDKRITITFHSDGNWEKRGFVALPAVVPQSRVLNRQTWSGFDCDTEKSWSYAGVEGTGCAPIPDGRAICVVKPDSLPGNDQWPPYGRLFPKFLRPYPCRFPFKYRGKTYHDCIKIDTDTEDPWCSGVRQGNPPVQPYFGPNALPQAPLKISCPTKLGSSDFYEETFHFDYCSSFKLDSTGNAYDQFSGQIMAEGDHQYVVPTRTVFVEHENYPADGGYSGGYNE